MATAKLMLWTARATKNGYSTVYIEVYANNKRKRIPTGVSIPKSHWNKNKQRVTSTNPDYLDLNSRLQGELAKYTTSIAIISETFEKDVMDVNLIDALSTTSKQERMAKLQSITPQLESKVVNGTPVFSYYEEWYNKCKDTEAYDTYRAYPTMKKHILRFDSQVTFEALEVSWYERFVEYMVEDRGLSDNSWSVILKRFKKYLKYCRYKNYFDVPNLDLWKLSDYSGNLYTLTYAEIKALEALPLQSTELIDTRNAALVQIFAFCRFADLKNLKKHNYVNGKLSFITNKTLSNASCELPTHVQSIIESYKDIPTKNNQLIPVQSIQKYNKALQKLLQMAGVNTPTEDVKYVRGKKIIEVKPKYLLISSHNLRKTGITLHLSLGTSITEVMAQSTHKDLQSFQRYVVHSEQQIATAIKKGWDKLDMLL